MSDTRNVSKIGIIGEPAENSMVGPTILFLLAIVYLLSPIDAIPDIPVIGHIDDLIVVTAATLNLLQNWLKNSSTVLSSILGLIKWLVIFAGIIVVLLFGIAGWGIVKSFMG